MATYAQYLAAINGKTFNSPYFHNASASSESASGVNNVYTYSGSLSGISSSSLEGTISSVDTTTGSFSLNGSTYFVHGSSVDGNDLVFSASQSGGPFMILAQKSTIPSDPLSYSTSNSYNAPQPVCFVTGTMIATPIGEVAIEDLRQGGEVTGADGRVHRILWIGHRHTECAKSPWKTDVSPVLFEAGAIADNVPSRPLMVSPGHSVEIESGWLIQAGHLVNGLSIRQVDVPSVTYWHVELAEHAILLANGVAAESYLDVGNRSEFANGGAAVTLHPRFVAEQLDRYCLPVIQDAVVRAYYRDKLADRARLSLAA